MADGDETHLMLPGRERSVDNMYTMGLIAKSVNTFLKKRASKSGRDDDQHDDAQIELQEKSPESRKTKTEDPAEDQGYNPQALSNPPPSTVCSGQNDMTDLEEQGSRRNTRHHHAHIVYGSKSIWHLMLYGPEMDEDDDHPRSDLLCGLVLLLALALATVYDTNSQTKSWPLEADIYHTHSESNNLREGSSYTCGCALPPSLQIPEELTEMPNVNVCYLSGSQKTVTILMFANSSSCAEEFIHQEIQANGVEKPINVSYSNGFKVTQAARELSIPFPASMSAGPPRRRGGSVRWQ